MGQRPIRIPVPREARALKKGQLLEASLQKTQMRKTRGAEKFDAERDGGELPRPPGSLNRDGAAMSRERGPGAKVQSSGLAETEILCKPGAVKSSSPSMHRAVGAAPR